MTTMGHNRGPDLDAKPQTFTRRVEWEDFPELCDLAVYAGRVEKGPTFPDPEFPACYEHLLNVLKTGGGWVCIRDDAIIGVLLVSFGSAPHAPSKRYAYNAHFWVIPDERRSKVGEALLNRAKTELAHANVEFRVMTNMGHHPEVLDRWCKQQGLVYAGGNFVVPIQPMAKPETDEIAVK